jgi:succinate dehydrogenase/fumarate reductase flavoprotein subunit
VTFYEGWLPERVDVLILGGGMSGLSAAATAAQAGAEVLVLEKEDQLGGSAAISVGMFWEIPDFETLRQRVPLGDPNLGQAIIEDYPDALDSIRKMGISVGDRVSGVMTVGIGHSIDVQALLARERVIIEKSGGQIACGVETKRLLTDEHGTVTGAEVHTPDGYDTRVVAGATILATGGFQGDPHLLSMHMGPDAYDMLVRSNPGSVGDGLRLGCEAGSVVSQSMSTFYGHLVPSPLKSFKEEQYMPLAQYHSNHCILVNKLGERFCDESQGDEVNNQALLAQPGARGVLICDDRVRSSYVVSEPFPNAGLIDRFEEARVAGARFASADTLDALAEQIASWEVEFHSLQTTLKASTALDLVEGTTLNTSLPDSPNPLAEPPFYALEVQPSITFTYGGLHTNEYGNVLDREGEQVSGLWAAGVDCGGLSNWTYAGGLAPAFIMGRRAALSALESSAVAPEDARASAGQIEGAGRLCEDW